QKVVIPKLERVPVRRGAPDAGALNKVTAQPSSSGGTGRAVGFGVAGLGIAGIAVGAVTGLMASSKASGAKNDPSQCVDGFCTAAGGDALNSAGTLPHVSTIGFAVGGLALVTGVLLIVTGGPSKKKEATTATARVVPTLGREGGGLSLVGSF